MIKYKSELKINYDSGVKKNTLDMRIHCSHRLNYASFCPIKLRKSKKKPPKTSDVVCESDEDDCGEMGGDAKTSTPKLFACPNEGCIRVYKRYGSMVNHVGYGKCKFQPERESLPDTAKIMYSKKLWGGEISIKTGITGSAATVVPLADSQTKEEERWALRTPKKAKPLARNRGNSWKTNSWLVKQLEGN